MRKPESADTPQCPHCDTALTPELVKPGIYLCPCCGKLFAVLAPPRER